MKHEYVVFDFEIVPLMIEIYILQFYHKGPISKAVFPGVPSWHLQGNKLYILSTKIENKTLF